MEREVKMERWWQNARWKEREASVSDRVKTKGDLEAGILKA